MNIAARFAAMQRDHFQCVYCGREANGGSLHVGYIVPPSAGGDEKTDNLATSCDSCDPAQAEAILDRL